MNNLNRNSILLIAIHSIHSIIELFINIFLVAYFLDLTGNNIVPTAVFYIFTYLLVSGGFVLIGPYVKCYDKLLIYRWSFILNAIVLLLVIYLKKDITHYIWILGFISGLEKALFYFPQNLMTSQESTGNALIKFNGYRFAWNGIIKIVMPVVLGWFISVDSFINTAIFVLFLTIIEFILSYMMKKSHPSYRKKFSLKAVWVFTLKKPLLKLSFAAETLRGFIFEALDVLVVLYVVYMFKTNLNLGIFTSVFAICTVATGSLFGRFCSYSSFNTIIRLSAIITFAAATWFVFDTDKTSFIIYNFAFATAAQLIRIITDINVFKTSQSRSVSMLYRVEFLSLREVFLGIGRVISFTLVIIAARSNNPEMLKYLILCFNLLIIFAGYLNICWGKKLQQDEAKKC